MTDEADGKTLIVLGDKQFALRRFTIGQLEDIVEHVNKATGLGSITLTKQLISAALRRDYEADAARIDEFEATIKELNEALQTIMRLAGFPVTRPRPP